MRVTLRCQKGWQKDRAVFEEMKAAIAATGRLADERPQEKLAGYLAERPSTLKNSIRVWAPCGCCWTYLSATASVLTQCDGPEHDFSWDEANRAIEALRKAEEPPTPEAPEGENLGRPKLEIVKLPQT